MATQNKTAMKSPPDRDWFCLRTQNKREHIAAAMLDKIETVEVFCPRISQFKKTRNGKKRYIEALFPGYIFARFNFANQYRRIIHTQGVTYLVEQGGKGAIPDKIIEELKISLPEQGVIEAPDTSCLPGAEIEVISGSLKGLQGTVLALLPANKRVEILLHLLGNEITVAVSTDHIHLASEKD